MHAQLTPRTHLHTYPSAHTLQVKKSENMSLTNSITTAVHSVELKLLFIPIFFIVLRIWSLLLVIIEVEAHKRLNCAAILFFLHMGVSGGVCVCVCVEVWVCWEVTGCKQMCIVVWKARENL